MLALRRMNSGRFCARRGRSRRSIQDEPLVSSLLAPAIAARGRSWSYDAPTIAVVAAIGALLLAMLVAPEADARDLLRLSEEGHDPRRHQEGEVQGGRNEALVEHRAGQTESTA